MQTIPNDQILSSSIDFSCWYNHRSNITLVAAMHTKSELKKMDRWLPSCQFGGKTIMVSITLQHYIKHYIINSIGSK
jgi:hypothetical protein